LNSAEVDFVLPLSRPITDINREELKSIFLPKGTQIFVNIMGINCSRDIWGDDANEWKPERWLEPLPKSVTDSHIPGIYMNSYVL
jgi:cytochrome P450